MSRTCNAEPGDLIEISRERDKHSAVYIGENEVVHFSKGGGGSPGLLNFLSSSTGIVKREKFTKVVGNHDYKVNNQLDEKYNARDPSIIGKEACAMVGSEPKYDDDGYNCEHFATEMRYGKAESRQAKNIASVIGAAFDEVDPVLALGVVVLAVVILSGAPAFMV